MEVKGGYTPSRGASAKSIAAPIADEMRQFLGDPELRAALWGYEQVDAPRLPVNEFDSVEDATPKLDVESAETQDSDSPSLSM